MNKKSIIATLFIVIIGMSGVAAATEANINTGEPPQLLVLNETHKFEFLPDMQLGQENNIFVGFVSDPKKIWDGYWIKARFDNLCDCFAFYLPAGSIAPGGYKVEIIVYSQELGYLTYRGWYEKNAILIKPNR